jgi:hypothetical protein
MEKFNRIYSLRVEVDNGVNTSPLRSQFLANKNIEITLPYSVEFSISRRTLTSAQTGTFRIYNLGPEQRNAIQKDFFQFTQLRSIQFFAGYDSPNGKFMPKVFDGTVVTAYSYRVGRDWITEIDAFDGGWQMATANGVSITLAPGTTASQVVSQLAALLPKMSGSAIVGNFPYANKRGEVLFGNVWDLLIQKSNGLVTIDNGQVKALQLNEVILGSLPLISPESGLLGSPKRTPSTLEFDMIFEPRLTVSQVVRLENFSNPKYNRNWKVIGFEHRGTISPSVAGQCLTSVRLWFTLEDLQIITGNVVI